MAGPSGWHGDANAYDEEEKTGDDGGDGNDGVVVGNGDGHCGTDDQDDNRGEVVMISSQEE